MDDAVDFLVHLAFILHLTHGMNNGAVMLAAEGATDFGKRMIRQLLTNKHGDLSRVRDAPGIAL